MIAPARALAMADLTRLLHLADPANGSPDELAIASLYDEVRTLARGLMRRERPDHTLAPTALANEAWLRLFGCEPTFANSGQFFAAAATTLRRILVEHGRRRARAKRGGDLARRDVDCDALAGPSQDERLLQLDAALGRLASFDPGKARLVELRFFAGLSVDEVAQVLEASPRTVAREWRIARAFLRVELGVGSGADELDD